mmetsp:Transcript_9412/g.18225  ORF Transcript_9412/g.18225 Transcript_9412/m.18225 type:complete len:256 (+) Transcript_9412:89-856(+)
MFSEVASSMIDSRPTRWSRICTTLCDSELIGFPIKVLACTATSISTLHTSAQLVIVSDSMHHAVTLVARLKVRILSVRKHKQLPTRHLLPYSCVVQVAHELHVCHWALHVHCSSCCTVHALPLHSMQVHCSELPSTTKRMCHIFSNCGLQAAAAEPQHAEKVIGEACGDGPRSDRSLSPAGSNTCFGGVLVFEVRRALRLARGTGSKCVSSARRPTPVSVTANTQGNAVRSASSQITPFTSSLLKLPVSISVRFV